MPHYRNRHLELALPSTLNYSPIVGLFGHRQVGKTTMVERLSGDYVSLDIHAQKNLAEENPEAFLVQRKSPFAIDECQLSPALFPALKEHVRKNKRPGQFLLTGSVRFSSRKQIRESLTGRIVAWELLPMDLAEMNEKPMPQNLKRLALSKSLEIPLAPANYWGTSTLKKYLEYGGMPGIFSIRNDSIRRQKLELQIETLLERDLRLLVQTTLSFHTLRNLMSVLATLQGEPFEIYEVSRRTQISVHTLQNLIHAFESMFLIRFLETQGTTKKKVLFFEDQGEATYLSTKDYGPIQDLVRFLYANLRTQWMYQNKIPVRMFQFRNRAGTYIPLVVEFEKKHPIGVIPILEETPSRQALASASRFIRLPGAKVLFVHTGRRDELIHPQLRILPIRMLV